MQNYIIAASNNFIFLMQYQAYHLYQHGITSREIYSNKVRICVYRDLKVEVST